MRTWTLTITNVPVKLVQLISGGAAMAVVDNRSYGLQSGEVTVVFEETSKRIRG